MGVASLEGNLERIASALERIAFSLEAIADVPVGPPGEHLQPSIKKLMAERMNGAVDPLTAAVEQPTYPPATYEEAQAAVMALIGRKNHDAAKALLGKFKVKFVKDLNPSDYGAVVAQAKDA
jgi:hypothetical protein